MGDLSDDELREILKNEYRDMRNLCTNKVEVSRVPVREGSGVLVHFKIIVHAKTYYLTTEDDTTPKDTNQIIFFIRVNSGYPKVKPDVYFEKGKRLAGVNTFRNGFECIDAWLYDEEHASNNSTLAGTMRKTIMDVIHVASVTRYDSMANRALEEWQRDMTKKGLLPSCDPAKIFKDHGINALDAVRRESVGLPGMISVIRQKATSKKGQIPLPGMIGGAK